MAIDDVKNEMAFAFKDKTLEKTDAKITDEEIAMQQYFYPLSLYQSKSAAVNKCHLQFSKEGKVMPC